MALFDRMGGLLGNLGDYGFGLPSNTGGLVADEDRDAINKRALLSGLISAGLTYAATPKNLNTGSALPYLGKAGLAGFNTSQDVVDRSLNTAYRNKILTGRDDGFSNINPLDVTPESLKLYIEGGKKDPSVLRKAASVEKPEAFTDTYKNVSLLEFGTANPSELTKEQRARLSSIIKGAEKSKETQDYTEPQLDQLTGKYVFLPKRPGLPIKDLQGNIVTDIKLPEKAGEKLTEGERTAGFLSTRLNNSLNQLKTVTGEKPSAASPNIKAEAVRFFTRSDYLKNLANPEARQQVEAAQYDILDSALTLGTGAAYTREQLESYRQSYFPQLGDKPKTVAD